MFQIPRICERIDGRISIDSITRQGMQARRKMCTRPIDGDQ